MGDAPLHVTALDDAGDTSSTVLSWLSKNERSALADARRSEFKIPDLDIAPDDKRPVSEIIDKTITPEAVISALDSDERTRDLLRADKSRPAGPDNLAPRAREAIDKTLPQVKSAFGRVVDTYIKWSHFNRWGFERAVPITYKAFSITLKVITFLLHITSPITTRIIGYAIKVIVPMVLASLCDPHEKHDISGLTADERAKYAEIFMNMPIVHFRYNHEIGHPRHVGTISTYWGRHGVGNGHEIPIIDMITAGALATRELRDEIERLRAEQRAAIHALHAEIRRQKRRTHT